MYTKKILMVDDHPLFLEGIKCILQQHDNEVDVMTACNFSAALDLIKSNADIDLVLLDLGLPDVRGVEGVELLRREHPLLPLIVLTACENQEIAQTILSLGAQGYILKSATSDLILSAINLVFSGGVYIPVLALSSTPNSQITVNPQKNTTEKPTITQRQLEVLQCLAEGKSNKIIAHDLKMAEGTVRVHCSLIFKALNVSNRTSAVLEAKKIGII